MGMALSDKAVKLYPGKDQYREGHSLQTVENDGGAADRIF